MDSRCSACISERGGQRAGAGYLLVRAGAYYCLLPATAVDHILPANTPLVYVEPYSEPCFAGMAILGGEGIPVFDLGLRLGLGGTCGPIVVVRTGSRAIVGLRTAGVVERIGIPDGQWTPVRPRSALRFAKWVTACWRGRSRACYLLDLEKLLPVAAAPAGQR